jgi:cysteine-rich repeat protein
MHGGESDGSDDASAGAGGDNGSGDTGRCEGEGELSCRATPSPQSLICKGGTWQVLEECETGQVCSATDATCKPLVPQCSTKKAGYAFCSGDIQRTCDSDLTTTTDLTCDGLCKNGACVAPACGDGKVEVGEGCDDGNLANADGCSKACALELTAIDSGGSSTCALFKDGRLKCWGGNDKGQLGIGDFENRGDDPDELGTNLPPVLTGVSLFSVGLEHACALSNTGLWCWGANDAGQLGQGIAGEPSARPLRVELGGTPRRLAAGHDHTCAILTDGSLKCWGSNGYGQLGVLSANPFEPSAPSRIPDTVPVAEQVTEIGAGNGFTCALGVYQDVYCWGMSTAGRLGAADGAAPPRPPINLGADFSTSALAVGSNHSCALDMRGSMKCWGLGTNGALGYDSADSLGSDPNRMGTALPYVAVGEPILLASAGQGTCVALSSGAVQCWGPNSFGFLGRPDLPASDNLGDEPNEMRRLEPIALGTHTGVSQITQGLGFACTLLTPGIVKCWGRNHQGQLGLGDVEDRGDDANELDDALPAIVLN